MSSLPPHPVLDLSRDPTSASTQLYKDCVAYNKAHGLPAPANLGQAVAHRIPGGKIAAIWAEPVVMNPSNIYGPSGGHDPLREVSAAYLKRMYGLNATAKNTFAYASHGRLGLHRSMGQTNKDYLDKNSALLIPNPAWPMYRKIAAQYKHSVVTYDVSRKDLADNVSFALEEDKEHNIMEIIFDPNQNPTGMLLDLRESVESVEKHNQQRRDKGFPPMKMTFDMPYPMACPRAKPEAGHYMDLGIESLLDNLETEWQIILSGSKTYAMADKGFHLSVIHPKFAKSFNDNAIVYGSGFDLALSKKMERILSPECDEDILFHFSGYKELLTKNRRAAENAFGENLVDGDPGFTCLVRLPSQFADQPIASQRHKKGFQIKNADSLVEYLAVEHDVVTVNNGKDKEGNNTLRLASAMENDVFEQALGRIQQGLALAVPEYINA